MRTALLIAVLISAFSVSARAEYKFAENWSSADTAIQCAFVTTALVDWGQTLYISKNPHRYYETNMLLGSHPSTSGVNTYFPLAILAHTVVAITLPPKMKVLDHEFNPRRLWQIIWIGTESFYIAKNASIGIKIDF